jgi:hypothetical protein
MTRRDNRLDTGLCLSLVAAGLGIRAYMLWGTGFDGLYGQDSYAYYDYAQDIIHGLLQGNLPTGFFWPIGYPSLLATIFVFTGATAGAGQGLSILLGALLTPLMYGILRTLGTQRLGAVATALTMLVCGQLNQSSLVMMSDVPALFWGLLSLWFLLKFQKDNFARHLVLASTCLAVATITRWTYGILFVLLLMSVLVSHRKDQLRTLFLALTIALIVIGMQFVISQQYASPGVQHAFVEGWRPENAIASQVRTSEGTFQFSEPNLRFYAKPLLDAYFLSPILLIWLMVGIYALKHRQPSQVILVVGGWLPYFFLIGIPQQNIRYGLMLFPVGAILVGLGVDWMMQQKWPSRVYAVFVMIFCAGLLHGGQTSYQTIQQFVNRHQQDRSTATWVAEQVEPDSTIYAFGLTLTLQHRTELDVRELYYESPQTLASADLQNAYLVVNLWNLESQWAGTDTYRVYTWLRDEPGLTSIGSNGHFTLFEIGGI